ncbi:MAG: glycoside hydrolase family 27 protein [Lachnospiraceae bacterium]|nr:glycoside hydrolase family 27 protein [Lachnospiraceae bacterium]
MIDKNGPLKIKDSRYRYDSFNNDETFPGKKNGRLPMMGWNSWNAFGSGNTEALTRAMADAIVDLGLDKLGYKYVVLDDGCYKEERVNGLLSNEEVKFPSGFKALSDHIHSKGLKFGMYNDIGTNLCAGAAVGTCGHEKEDARSYIEWGVDFIKVDNCYYPWDNATFSDEKNSGYTYAPHIRAIMLTGPDGTRKLSATSDGRIKGNGPVLVTDGENDHVENIGTFDGTGPEQTPLGEQSGELCFDIGDMTSGDHMLKVLYRPGLKPGCGAWLQVAVDSDRGTAYYYDDLICDTESLIRELAMSEDNADDPKDRKDLHDSDENIAKRDFVWSAEIPIRLESGSNTIRLMNHRRQENTLYSYARLLEGFYEADKDNDIVMSLCEWGKTQPQNWGYKVGSSWRILNDITFRVGSDGDPGYGEWQSDYTPGVATQYNKAVIMDEYAGLQRGWNDPDMLMVGMEGLDDTQCRTHFAMWCMMNSPLMLGLDLRRVKKGDPIYSIIANKDLIDLNQDALGIQAKRIYSDKAKDAPDKEYIRDNDRADILAKPLSDGSIAIAFFNLSDNAHEEEIKIDVDTMISYIGDKMVSRQRFLDASKYKVKDLWNKSEYLTQDKQISVDFLPAHGSMVYKISCLT